MLNFFFRHSGGDDDARRLTVRTHGTMTHGREKEQGRRKEIWFGDMWNQNYSCL